MKNRPTTKPLNPDKNKGVREKKSPDNPVITHQLKKLKQFTQSTKNLTSGQTTRTKKFKSPDPNISNIPMTGTTGLKKHK